MFVTFPLNLRFQTSGFQVVGASSEPKQSVGGAFSVQPRLGAHWVGAVTAITTNEETILALQSFVAGMEGMLGTTSVPVFQRYSPRDGQGRLAPRRSTSALGNGLMNEGAGSETSEFWGFDGGPAISGNLAEAAALRAAEITIARTNYSEFRPGHDFSIAGRMHRAIQIWPDGENDRVRITPPLRTAADAGEMVIMDTPHCLMRFASEGEGQLVYETAHVHRVTMNFVEAI
ncbi:hypothetical protein [Oceaniovalibus sp. ACAM 378]|uniref:hypothetical protein n=1 Tax=Oceaniovalibus sp. ACAM 378 TaxID=2599923 RepID=UPI0011D85C07|nr:hypothetical protein [Oceaniovalibus sp. ACAM 378]TYB83937.1 hypothetical protein FQ320_23560 [Oceaniovalibus sp. ACAM 378]